MTNHEATCLRSHEAIGNLEAKARPLRERLSKIDARIEDKRDDLRTKLIKAKLDDAVFTGWMIHHYIHFGLHHEHGLPNDGTNECWSCHSPLAKAEACDCFPKGNE